MIMGRSKEKFDFTTAQTIFPQVEFGKITDGDGGVVKYTASYAGQIYTGVSLIALCQKLWLVKNAYLGTDIEALLRAIYKIARDSKDACTRELAEAAYRDYVMDDLDVGGADLKMGKLP